MTSVSSGPAPRRFDDFDLPPVLVRALRGGGITEPTAIQNAVIPAALEGRNVLGRARTGSGKTLAFGLPLLARLRRGSADPGAPRGLIVLPTRELANQVRETLEPLAQRLGLRVATVYGGVSYARQVAALRRGTDVIVATPGRLGDLIDRGECRLDAVEVMVLDEADHLCDLGFFKPIDALMGQTPASSQRLLLSATLDGDVDRLVRRHIAEPVVLSVDDVDAAPSAMAHHLVVTSAESKKATVMRLAEANPRSIVFTRTRRGAANLARQLNKRGVSAVELHGDLSQNARERNLRRFRRGEATTVVATDVAARGIHIDGIDLVVHYDAPAEAKAYTHRSGRTARAGQTGTVITLAVPADVDKVVRLQRHAGVEAEYHEEAHLPSPLIASSLSGLGRSLPPSHAARGGARGRPSGTGRRRPVSRHRPRARRR